MNAQRIRRLGAGLLVLIWAGLTAAGWLLPPRELSESERRPLAQLPQFSAQTLLDGSFMTKFESFSLDQFPLRDSFRRMKALFHRNVLRQKDNNKIYLAQGHAAQLMDPVNEQALSQNLQRLQLVYDRYLKDTDCRSFFAVVPDKGYYLAEQNGYPTMDYEALLGRVEEGLYWAEQVQLTDCLTAEDYYRTDTHWRQEALLPVAQRLLEAMGTELPPEGFTEHRLQRPFYGVYYGQAALPMEPDAMVLMEHPILEQCTVYDHEAMKETGIYNMEKLEARDLYEVFLSGARSLLTIENPQAETDRELIVFRDSFGSSLVPLLAGSYAKITLVDIRYLSTEVLGQFVEFEDQDVLFLYSTIVLNTEGILR